MNERSAILAHFRVIDRDDVIAMKDAEPGASSPKVTQMAEEIARERGISSPTWVFWHQQSAWAFGRRRQSRGPAPRALGWGP